jgi:hypothetical protein
MAKEKSVMIMIIERRDWDTTSWQIGYLVGAKHSKGKGIRDICDVQADAIKSWCEAQRSMRLDLIDYCSGYLVGAVSYAQGVV